ncbi:hypothetical protein OF001_U90006 [Pseudomonas sp. OF001]|nr:hypothetical protein OF001_U90006 [Pseudomonas sp. OF001]
MPSCIHSGTRPPASAIASSTSWPASPSWRRSAAGRATCRPASCRTTSCGTWPADLSLTPGGQPGQVDHSRIAEAPAAEPAAAELATQHIGHIVQPGTVDHPQRLTQGSKGRDTHRHLDHALAEPRQAAVLSAHPARQQPAVDLQLQSNTAVVDPPGIRVLHPQLHRQAHLQPLPAQRLDADHLEAQRVATAERGAGQQPRHQQQHQQQAHRAGEQRKGGSGHGMPPERRGREGSRQGKYSPSRPILPYRARTNSAPTVRIHAPARAHQQAALNTITAVTAR